MGSACAASTESRHSGYGRRCRAWVCPPRACKLLRYCDISWLVLMGYFRVRFKVLAAVLLTTLLVVIGTLNLRARAAWTDPWDGVFWEESSNRLRAAEVWPGGPGAGAGVRAGDLLVAMNGREIANLGEYFSLLDRRGAHALLTYTIRSPGSASRDVTVEIGSRDLLAAKDAI